MQTRPFQPFRLYLSDGATYDVRHPELVMLGRRSPLLGLAKDPEDTLYDRTVDIDLLHVVRTEPAQGGANSNGG